MQLLISLDSQIQIYIITEHHVYFIRIRLSNPNFLEIGVGQSSPDVGLTITLTLTSPKLTLTLTNPNPKETPTLTLSITEITTLISTPIGNYNLAVFCDWFT